MNFKKCILLILILGISISPAKSIHSMDFLKRNYKTVIVLGISAYVLYKYLKKEKTNTIDTTPTDYLTHTPITENFLHKTLESSSLQPSILNSQGFTEGIRDNILSSLTKYSCLNKFTHHGWPLQFVSIDAICQLPNGNLASSSTAGLPDFPNFKIWDIRTGKCLRTLKGHDAQIVSFCILPNGNLVSCAFDSTIKIWDTNTGSCIRTLTGHDDLAINSVCTLSNGNIASGSADNRIKIWNPNTGECIHTLEGHDGYVGSLCVLPNGNLASGSKDGLIKIWDIDTGECLCTLDGYPGLRDKSIFALCVLPNSHLAAGSRKGLKIWSPNTGECIHTLESHEAYVRSLCIANGNLISCDMFNSIKIWNINNGECLQNIKSDNVITLCALSNGLFASGSMFNSEIKVWGNKFDIKV